MMVSLLMGLLSGGFSGEIAHGRAKALGYSDWEIL